MVLISLGRKNVFIMVPNNNDFITELQSFVHKRSRSLLGGGWYVIKTTNATEQAKPFEKLRMKSAVRS